MKHELLAIGSIVVDRIKSIDIPGGSGPNVALDAHLLGLNTALLSSFAKDSLGQSYKELLIKQGLHIYVTEKQQELSTICEFLVKPDGTTEDGEWIDNGLEQVFNTCAPSAEITNSAELVHLGTCVPLFALQVAKITSEKQRLSYNPGAWIESDFELFRDTYPFANYIFLNEKEMGFLISNRFISQPDELIYRCNQIVIVTKGKLGTTIYTQEGSIDVPPFNINPVEETGAGDAFAAAFLWAQKKGYSLQISARLGNLLGALAVKTFGGQLSKKNIESFYKIATRYELIDISDTMHFPNN
jgi:ribokinase